MAQLTRNVGNMVILTGLHRTPCNIKLNPKAGIGLRKMKYIVAPLGHEIPVVADMSPQCMLSAKIAKSKNSEGAVNAYTGRLTVFVLGRK